MEKQCLALEGMKFFANHGYYSSENEKGGEYIVDVYIYHPLYNAGKHDELNLTVNYESIYQIVKSVMLTPKKLIEAVAYQIQETIKSKHPNIESFIVRVRKLNPPINGDVVQSFVEFSYEKDHGESWNQQSDNNKNYWEERGKY